jgi:hypothetical protein
MSVSDRTFGVEIEFIVNGARSESAAQEVALVALRNAGIPVQLEGYNHSTREHWKIVHDGSVGGSTGAVGGELVSPILKGEEGLETLRKVVRALAAAGVTVDRTCGLHVHVGARDLKPTEIMSVVQRYAKHESTMDAHMPESRRRNNCCHVRSLGGHLTNNDRISKVQSVSSVEDLVRFFSYERYLKVNVQSYARQGTIEFRQHSGSVNASKIVNWVLFCTNFVDTTVSAFRALVPATPARRGRPCSQPSNTGNPYREGSKKNKLWTLLGSGRTLSLESLALSLETSTASVAAMLSQFKRDHSNLLRRCGYRGHYRYYFNTDAMALDALPVAPSASSTGTLAVGADITSVVTLNPFEGLDREVVAYYSERRMELAA